MRKQIISSVFHRRKNQNSTVAPADVDADDSKPPIQKVPSPADSVLPIGQINIIQRGQPSIKVIQFAANANKSANDSPPIDVVDTPAATITMKTPDREIPVSRDNYGTKSTTTFNGNVDSKPYSDTDPHLSAREQIWYKNQMYLLAKQQQQQQHQAASRGMSPSSRVKSTSTTDYNRKRYSPSGVDEFELADGDSTQTGDFKRKIVRAKQCSKRNYVCHDNSDDDYNYNDGEGSDGDYYDDENDDNTWTTPSRKLPDDEHSCTTQFTSVLDDDTRTNLSSLLFEEDESCSDSSEIFDGLALDSAISGYTNATESESIFSALDDGASTSYVFELVDDGGKQRRKYQLGVGHNPDISRRRKHPWSSTKSRRTDERLTTKAITSRQQTNRREKNSTVDSNSVEGDTECPLLQVLSEEIAGTLKDAKLALDQVLHAFCISLDNVDQITDELSVARLELRDLCQKRGSRRGHAMNSFYY